MLVRNVLLALGAAASVAGLLLLFLWLRQPTEAPKPIIVTREIVVAARPIATGSLLTADDLAWKTVAADALPAGSFARGQASETDLIGALAQRDTPAGAPIVAANILRPNDRGFLSAVLRPGYRAVSIAVDAPQTASGLLRPGDHVDVILTQNFGDAAGSPARKSVGETVLQDLRIVAIDQSLTPGGVGRAANQPISVRTEDRVPKTVTLEVVERDAEKLLVAVQLGKVEIAVRALQSPQASATSTPPDGPTWAADVSPALRSLSETPKPIASEPLPVGPSREIIILRGSKTGSR